MITSSVVTRPVRIVDATIRDGGYMVDHHYSRVELATLVGGLDRAGVPLIEVGHGNGVGSQHFRDPKLRATALPLVDDRGHAEVATRVAQRAQVGVIYTAGQRFGPIEYIDQIADFGYAFVRLAAMPDEVDDELFAYVRRAKDRGLLVSINMMQTYVKTPAEVAALAARAADHGLDWFYVVDSGGGMMDDDVKRYVEAILAAAPVEVGFHAHNNLGCAVANCLAAVAAGATLVDGTLNGIGRATGNPATEQLAVALRDRLDGAIDLDVLVGLGTAVRSLFDDAGNDPIDFISGGALVHSRNVPKILEAARQRDRSPCSFLLAVGAEARRRGTLTAMSYSDELYEAASAASSPARPIEPSDAMVDVAADDILAHWNGGPRRAIEEVSLRSRQRHRPSVVHVSRSALCAHAVPWQGAVIGVTIPWADDGWDVEASRLPDFVLFDDGDPEPPVRGTIATWRIPFADLYARAVQDRWLALGRLGFSPWCPGDAAAAERLLGALPRATERPTGAVAILLDDPALDDQLAAGDIGVVAGAWSATRALAAERRGARLVEPDWPGAVATIAASTIALHHELASVDPGKLDHGTWDPDRAMLLETDDPVAASREAGRAFIHAIIRGARRL